MRKKNQTEDRKFLADLSPDIWKRLEDIAEPERIPKYDGLFEGSDYRGHGEHFIEFCEEQLIGFDLKTNEFKTFRFAKWQKEIIREAFKAVRGTLKYITIGFFWARRHGKTELFSMYDVYRAANYPNQQVAIGSNSAAQGEETAYKWAVLLCLNSPNLRKQVEAGLIKVSNEKITFRITKSEIHNITSNDASAYGRRLSVAHLTELHAAQNNKLYTALAGSVGDSKDGVVLADSTVGAEDNIVWELINLFEDGGDDSLFVSYLSYDDLSDALKNSPEWIDRRWLKSRSAQSLPGEFRKFHLNKPAGKADPMFTREEWQACILPHVRAPLSPEYIKKNIAPRMLGERLIFGVGLDRAQSYSKNPDRTVLTLTAKGFLKNKYYKKTEKTITDAYGDEKETEEDNTEYWVIDSVEMPRVNDAEIKRYLSLWHAKYHPSSYAFERYETDDLARTCERNGLPVEAVSPNALTQRDAFDMVYRAVAQGRCWIPDSLWLLIYEGYSFTVDYSGAQPHFGLKSSIKATVTINGVKQKVFLKDDAMKSFAWSIYGMRAKNAPPTGFADVASAMPAGREENERIMNSYEIQF
jgi:hypothetical protein